MWLQNVCDWQRLEARVQRTISCAHVNEFTKRFFGEGGGSGPEDGSPVWMCAGGLEEKGPNTGIKNRRELLAVPPLLRTAGDCVGVTAVDCRAEALWTAAHHKPVAAVAAVAPANRQSFWWHRVSKGASK
jgi:hypothetical protein